MEHRRLGKSGLAVSRLGLGTMTWGRDTDADDAAVQLKAFLDAGGNLIDTADVYTDGVSESIIGSLLGEVTPRESIVIATKAGITPHGLRRRNASRGHLLSALDASLIRLGTDYIDLWQIHGWDSETPWEETFSAIEIAMNTGRVRYAGVSNFNGWQMAAAATLAAERGVPLVSNQIEYSLLERAPERDIVPAADHCGLGLLTWSPLGRGVLTGKYRGGAPADSRGSSPHFRSFIERYLNERSSGVVEAVATAADGLGESPLTVALAWIRDQPGVTAPIIGARTVGQLMGLLQTEDLVLPAEIRTALNDVSAPPG